LGKILLKVAKSYISIQKNIFLILIVLAHNRQSQQNKIKFKARSSSHDMEKELKMKNTSQQSEFVDVEMKEYSGTSEWKRHLKNLSYYKKSDFLSKNPIDLFPKKCDFFPNFQKRSDFFQKNWKR
jgi:hypothetical protein